MSQVNPKSTFVKKDLNRKSLQEKAERPEIKKSNQTDQKDLLLFMACW